MPRAKILDYNEAFPKTTGECWICEQHSDDVRVFMGRLVHILCLQRHVAHTVTCFQDIIDASKRRRGRPRKTSLPR